MKKQTGKTCKTCKKARRTDKREISSFEINGVDHEVWKTTGSPEQGWGRLYTLCGRTF